MGALNDAVAHPKLVPRFEGENGWNISHFRGATFRSVVTHRML